LRFPRFIRERPDKTPESATTTEQIIDMYLNQRGGTGEEKGEEDDNEDE
jgi:DNA ligase-1